MSQGPAGGALTKGVVADTVETYITGEIQPLSINTEGRLRVSQVAAATYMEFFVPFDFGRNADIYELTNSPWEALL